jgi:hypothetical protein
MKDSRLEPENLLNSLFSEGLDAQQHSERGKVYRAPTNQTFPERADALNQHRRKKN